MVDLCCYYFCCSITNYLFLSLYFTTLYLFPLSPCMFLSYLFFISCKGLGSRPTSVEPPHLIPSNSTPHQLSYQQHSQQQQGVVQQFQQQDSDAAGLRRVCSLSDLTKSGSGGSGTSQRRMLPAPPISGRAL